VFLLCLHDVRRLTGQNTPRRDEVVGPDYLSFVEGGLDLLPYFVLAFGRNHKQGPKMQFVASAFSVCVVRCQRARRLMHSTPAQLDGDRGTRGAGVTPACRYNCGLVRKRLPHVAYRSTTQSKPEAAASLLTLNDPLIGTARTVFCRVLDDT